MPTNRQITLAARPAGFPEESDFRLVEAPVPEPGPGEVLVRIAWLSVDPYMRGRMRDAASYAAPLGIGEVMTGGAIGKVIESREPHLRAGEIVEGMFGWQEYAIARAHEVRKVDPSLAPVSTAVGVLGMPGMTAYFGLLEVGRPKPGDTVVVSGAAGAVGMVVGQIAKICGCRVVGIAGADEKVEYITRQLGFDAGFNYKTARDYPAKIRELCPAGVDVYFDNVGGPVSDAVWLHLALHARIAVCGQISQYNLERPEAGPRLLFQLIGKSARAEGFLVSDFQQHFPEAMRRMAAWIREGRLRYHEEVAIGIENAPRAFLDMMRGKNLGKQLVKVSEL
jgi:NADPH-dependent curcumin reductase CurA